MMFNKRSFFVVIILTIFIGVGIGIVYALTTVTDSFVDSSKISTSGNVTIDPSNGGQVFMTTTSTWTCGSDWVDSRDGRIYKTVLIGSQCWMQENLNIGTMITVATVQTNNGIIEKYCVSDSTTNCQTYGGLYRWDEAMNYSTNPGAQGICPIGWHVPTHYEFTDLELAVCTSETCLTDFPYDYTTTGLRGTNEGTTLKSVSGPFKSLFGGMSSTSFVYYGLRSYFWTSTQSTTNAWYRYLLNTNTVVYRGTTAKTSGHSIRCVKD